jgi:hypothetical protein
VPGCDVETSGYVSRTFLVLAARVCVGTPFCLFVCLCEHLPVSPFSNKLYPLILKQLLYCRSHAAITDVIKDL